MNKLINKYFFKNSCLFKKTLVNKFITVDTKFNLNYFCYFQNMQSIYKLIGVCSTIKLNKIFIFSCFHITSIFKNIKLKQIFFCGNPFLFFLKKIKNSDLKKKRKFLFLL